MAIDGNATVTWTKETYPWIGRAGSAAKVESQGWNENGRAMYRSFAGPPPYGGEYTWSITEADMDTHWTAGEPPTHRLHHHARLRSAE